MQHKTAMVVNKAWRDDVTKVLNATGHVAQALGRLQTANERGAFVDYKTSDGWLLPAISRGPYVLLTGSPAKMWALLQAGKDNSLSVSGFVETMFVGGTDVQLEETVRNPHDAHTIVCVGVCGAEDIVNNLTKKFSLFRTS